jgi:hypothetical protein
MEAFIRRASMIEAVSQSTNSTQSTTLHGMLIVWGYFAQQIGLVQQLKQVPVAQKTVLRAPQENLVELLIGLLTGMERLSDLSGGAAPLTRDAAVAEAWDLQPLASASGVSRTLHACDRGSVEGVKQALATVSRPFVRRAVDDLCQRGAMLQLDVDLTGRSVSPNSCTFPDAAFGYMDGEVQLGYQVAPICLQTELYGRQWLATQHHPGNTVSAPCLLSLVEAAEQGVECHPRRRVELVQQRIATCQQAIAGLSAELARHQQRVASLRQRGVQWEEQISVAQDGIQVLLSEPISARQPGRYSRLSQLERQRAGWQSQLRRAAASLARAQTTQQRCTQHLDARREELDYLQARSEEFNRQNAQQPNPPRCCVRMDAAFCSGQNLTELIELGYDVESKFINDAPKRASLKRTHATTAWCPVSANAEMIAWTDYYVSSCPYPLNVALERFHGHKGTRYSVLVRNQHDGQTTRPDLPTWFHDYNARQTIEAGIKEQKTTFKLQHLMSRSPAGIEIQVHLTALAANMIRWAKEPIDQWVEHTTDHFRRVLASSKQLVHVAANSQAAVECPAGRTVVHFSSQSGLAGVSLCTSRPVAFQLHLGLARNHHLSSA